LVALLAGVELHEVPDGLEDVLVGEDRLVRRSVLALLVPLELGERTVARLRHGLLVRVVELLHGLPARLQLRREHALRGPELLRDLVAADLREVVALGVEEQVLEERAGGLRRRRLTGPELAVDVLERLLGRV